MAAHRRVQGAIIVVAALAGPALAGDGASSPQQRAEAVADAADDAQKRGRSAAQRVPQPNEATPAQRRAAQRILEQASETVQARAKRQRGPRSSNAEEADPRYRYLIFASRSMGESGLKDLFKRAAAFENVDIVFRGIPEGTTITEGTRDLGRLIRQVTGTPSVKLDPPAFRKHDVTRVPTTIVLNDGAVVARASGFYGIAEIQRRLKNGRTGDYGQLGPTRKISEPDLIKVMKAKAKKLDMDQIKKRAKQSYWSDARFHVLQTAKEANSYTIDPTVVAQRDITTPNGKVVVEKGTTVNPLNKRPLEQRIIVFDATDPRQVKAAADLDDGAPNPIYLVTAFDRDRGWDHYRSLTERFDAPVYRLTRGLKKRFQLTRVPAVITSEDKRFHIREIPAKRYQITQTRHATQGEGAS